MTITVNDLGTMPNGEVVKQVVIENANGHKLGLVSCRANSSLFTSYLINLLFSYI